MGRVRVGWNSGSTSYHHAKRSNNRETLVILHHRPTLRPKANPHPLLSYTSPIHSWKFWELHFRLEEESAIQSLEVRKRVPKFQKPKLSCFTFRNSGGFILILGDSTDANGGVKCRTEGKRVG